MVYNTRTLPAAKVPHTRRQLLDRLRAEGAPLRGKVGTYDIERSSVGYLLATQDAQRGSIAGALLGALGDNDVVREERTGVLLDKVASGQLRAAGHRRTRGLHAGGAAYRGDSAHRPAP
ncbi:hypothetical protein G6F23_014807 [Rhizopus arrhizus]|nr:hypothetical protein G6F23_014807 [Rhizopus arrhizus]